MEIKKLKIGELELLPYSYKERFEESALIIEAKVELTGEQFSKLKQMMRGNRYFQVERQGVDTREMRFGLMKWSEHGQCIKHEVLLIDKEYDLKAEKSPLLYDPEISNIQDMLAETTEILGELVNTLENKGLLHTIEVEGIKSKAHDRVHDRKREFYKVHDIDEEKWQI